MGGGGGEGFLLLAGGAERGGGGGGASSSSEEMLMTSQGKLLAAEDEEGPGPKRVRRGRSGGFGRPGGLGFGGLGDDSSSSRRKLFLLRLRFLSLLVDLRLFEGGGLSPKTTVR